LYEKYYNSIVLTIVPVANLPVSIPSVGPERRRRGNRGTVPQIQNHVSAYA